MATKATREEVLAAVQAYSVRDKWLKGSGSTHFPCTKADIIAHVAEAHGYVASQSKYVSAMSEYRRFVSVTSVTNWLETLAEEGEIASVGGDHWSLTGRYNINSRSTYYLSQEAMELAAASADEKSRAKILSRATEHATAVILEKYASEWEELRKEMVAAVAEPNHASLWEVGTVGQRSTAAMEEE